MVIFLELWVKYVIKINSTCSLSLFTCLAQNFPYDSNVWLTLHFFPQQVLTWASLGMVSEPGIPEDPSGGSTQRAGTSGNEL